jgi:2-deoxy-D-gluconate 3-dehydrogenase
LAEEFEVKVASIVADVADPAQAVDLPAAVAESLGRVDILINNAGINIRRPPHEMSLEDWQRVLDVNLTSAFLLSKAAYPLMKRGGGGKVINIGSMTSIFGSSFAPAYAASKGAIVQLTKSCALAWAMDNIQVNAILPGWFDTELTQQARVEVPDLYNRVVGRIPMGRWAKPADIAGTAVWLSSSASDYVTGVAVAVDGGYSSAL